MFTSDDPSTSRCAFVPGPFGPPWSPRVEVRLSCSASSPKYVFITSRRRLCVPNSYVGKADRPKPVPRRALSVRPTPAMAQAATAWAAHVNRGTRSPSRPAKLSTRNHRNIERRDPPELRWPRPATHCLGDQAPGPTLDYAAHNSSETPRMPPPPACPAENLASRLNLRGRLRGRGLGGRQHPPCARRSRVGGSAAGTAGRRRRRSPPRSR